MKRSPEEVKAWKDKMRGFVKQASALSPEERITISARMSIVTCEGHALSAYNQIFLFYQTNEPLTIIGGFHQWEKAGHKVRKGQHVVGYIYVPMISKPKEDAPETDPEKTDLRFRMVPVFDVSQTKELQAA